ncbi:hypothetical protein [Ferruginibacter sp. HRS2-29]|uniref:hypothetical protein n=1 Tax=Ferruginibacter sp. HRS2-29 TaxID=2487334 RepID=UPI0020CF2D50|nr:hypothetical protein [Ferruginibacter sp. HRS2-29]MCP9753531.1 DinB family protein [Ferruginibacter sp. HRS2-29]
MIFLQLTSQLDSLKQLLLTMSDQQYRCEIRHLKNASIGAHARHIIELLQCAVSGYECNRVDYVNRKRNIQLETDRLLATGQIEHLINSIQKPDSILRIITEESGAAGLEVSTTYFREIVYNTEHAVHHLALIRVGLIEMDVDLVEEDFGIASSTIRYKHSLAQNQITH